jgi:tRNA-splicing ligase RtcB
VFTDLAGVGFDAQAQARAAASLPWTRGLALMPDVHRGFGVPVGCVMVTEGAVSPAAVGVDVACGMAAVPTGLTASDLPDDLSGVRAAIESAIPVGFSGHGASVDFDRVLPGAGWKAFWAGFSDLHEGVQGLLGRTMRQCGTLGGGNHFLEVCLDEDGRVWLMLHSGSRGIGKELAERHITAAKSLPHNQDLPGAARDLAVVLAGSPQMDAYRRDLYWAQEYAFRNRAVMLALFKGALVKALGRPVSFGETTQAHHNYASEETWDGVDVFVTRKGAISAAAGVLGIIPGSMGASSFIVRGLGNPLSFNSASHGAGRSMSRAEAKRRFTVEDVAVQTAGIECRKDEGVIDEIPAAYKDIEVVMGHQSDLVEVVHRLHQVVCVKG